ncbi:MAG TPA: hypothetical protein VE890_04680, partial [Thermoguttaceae bacterium]|nr:hypothetical protein [Thermoguttaceae bacterium]
NVAAGLLELFPPARVASLRQKAEELFPSGKFEFDPIGLQRVISFGDKHESARLRIQEILRRPKCDFAIPFKKGFLADLEFVDAVWLCASLEAFKAADSLSSNDSRKAIESLWSMLRLASCLGAEKHIETRMEAAYLRTKAFVVLQAIVDRPSTKREHLRQLQAMVQDHMKTWPHDSTAWFGDRAMGLHAYEMVRDGSIMELLTLDELERFAEENILLELDAASKSHVDTDELYYLETMRKIIESCKNPYFMRVTLFDDIYDEMQETRNSPEFPMVAARLLLPNIQQAQAIQAQDRANWEAWSLGLAAAIGKEPPAYTVNPLTGKKYELTTNEDQTVVGNFGSGEDDDNPSIIIPDWTNARRSTR